MKTKKRAIVAIVIVVILAVAAIVIYSKFTSDIPQDGVNAVETRFENLRDVRYAEVFLIGGNGITKNLEAAFYNTTELNNAADQKNTCPQALWDEVDPEELKEKYDVLKVFKNGPRHWVMDWIKIPVSKEVFDFNGLKARWFGQVVLPPVDLNKKGSTGYKPTTVARSSLMGFDGGKQVFILEDPQGRPWVMQAYGLIVDPSLTYEGLSTLGEKLVNMPEGWKFRTQVLERELVIHADKEGNAYIVQDELGNTYDLCDERTTDYIPKK